jgi:hypothetical protein
MLLSKHRSSCARVVELLRATDTACTAAVQQQHNSSILPYLQGPHLASLISWHARALCSTWDQSQLSQQCRSATSLTAKCARDGKRLYSSSRIFPHDTHRRRQNKVQTHCLSFLPAVRSVLPMSHTRISHTHVF